MDQFRNQTLSASRLNQFESCSLAFRFKYIDKLPEPPGAAAFRGSVVHLALEHLYGLPAAERTMAKAEEFVSPAFEELLKAEPANAVAVNPNLPWPSAEYELAEAEKSEFIEICKGFVRNYFKVENPSTLSPKAVEYKVAGSTKAGHKIMGYIDRLEESESGLIRISDYKTGATPNPRFRDKAWFQLQIYALLIFQETGKIAKELKLIYLKDGAAITNSPTMGDLELVENRVITIADAIDDAIINKQFHPKEGPLCNFCNFQSICPAKGGEAPALPY
ncbi:MAG: hypothetical protein RL038_1190 [Actinomycetota bacterium]|jgi:putative RecB family exonuclease